MNVFRSTCPVPISVPQKPNQMAFDGCHYYLTLVCDRKILKLDENLTVVHCFDCCRAYDCLCYDPKSCCFWASCKRCPRSLFRLTCECLEVDCLSLYDCPEARGEIVGLSYNCCEDSLFVAFPGVLLERKKKDDTCCVIHREKNAWITGVLCLSPGYLLTLLDGTQRINAFGPGEEGACLLGQYEVEPDFMIQTMVYRPGDWERPDCLVCFAVKKGCYPYLYEKALSQCELAFTPCRCNHIITKACCNPVQERVSCQQAKAEVIQSVALMETSLAHILNAEGEKLQRVLADSCDIDEIMAVNKEINKTIINATHLEHLLYAKLDLVAECCPTKTDELPCCPFSCQR